MLVPYLLLASLGAVLSASAAPNATSAGKAPSALNGPSGSRKHVEWKHFDCGTTIDHGGHDFKNKVHELHTNRKKFKGAPGAKDRTKYLRARDGSIQVDAYFHVVTTAAKASQFTDSMLQSQLDTMNTAYAPIGVQFTLQDTSFTTNDDWAVGNDDADAAMKAALRQGGYSALNVYFQSDLTGNILGKCSLPSGVAGDGSVDKSTYVSDGCNVQAGTLPGSYVLGYNEGMTAVHETGHWLGLLHTFEGYSCSGDGDFIDDTPLESVSTDGCPTSPAKDSCPSQDGGDPIHNYMDYSTDACYEAFTDGQQERIQDMWSEYRQGK